MRPAWTTGGHDDATLTDAGSQGTNAHCHEVLTALNAGSGNTVDTTYSYGIGCAAHSDTSRWRMTDPPTDPSRPAPVTAPAPGRSTHKSPSVAPAATKRTTGEKIGLLPG